jgi:hypothetical protein
MAGALIFAWHAPGKSCCNKPHPAKSAQAANACKRQNPTGDSAMDELPAQEEQVWQPSQRSKNSSKNGGKGYRHTTGSATPAPARTRGSRTATGKPVAKTGKKASRSATPKRGKRS